MLWSAGSARQRAWACLVVVGSGGVVAGLLAGVDPSAAQTAAQANPVANQVQAKELSPSQVVAFRFPPAWSNVRPASAPAVTAVAKHNLLDPNPTYALASADSQPVVLPRGLLAYAESGPQSAPVQAAPIETAAVETAPAPQRETVRAAERHAPAPKVARASTTTSNNNNSGVLFNDAQLASIKLRLRLTQDQEYYWPQIEAALRAISVRVSKTQSAKGVTGSKAAASIDPNSAEVQQLKSAAIPLIMSMREDQKREVRALARLMGLEAVASAI
jgi:hypothetical protein